MRQKTQTRQVYNEELGCYEWKEVETGRYVFDETDKIAIAREYYERKCPASEYFLFAAKAVDLVGNPVREIGYIAFVAAYIEGIEG